MRYCQTLVRNPSETVIILISDLIEGGDMDRFLRRAAELKASGVNLICLSALSDSGASMYDHRNAATLAALEIPVFACTPDKFPELRARAIRRQPLESLVESA